MPTKKPTIRKTKLSQTINLKELFGKSFKGQSSIRQALGQAIIDRMIERTEAGKAVNGRNLKSPYSKQYANSLEFKAAGKSRGSVNMRLTGDMLRSIDVLDDTANTITVGIDDLDEAPKAYNHQVGDTVPRRPFFGITKKELNDIKKDFREDVKNAFERRGDNRRSMLEALAERILRETRGDRGFGDGEG